VRPIRVLVVDDSAAVRRILGAVLAAEPDLEVVGMAASGPAALARLEETRPDVVTLDVDMDGMSGLETLRRLRAERPRLPVVMFSALTQRGAATTIDALLLGASDYVAKPSGASGTDGAVASVREQLVPRLRELTRQARRGEAPRAAGPSPGARVDVVAVGVSTGGPSALLEVLPRLPADLPVPLLIVQHMPPTFTRLLADGLARKCRIPVSEAEDGAPVRPGAALIAPGGLHLEVARDAAGQPRARLTDAPPEQSCRPSVDVLFRSAARVYGAGVLAIVLTGMGQDGLQGVERVREAGGRALAQDEATSVVWGMPGFVARAGLADAVLPLQGIADEVLARVGRGAVPC
jgi:two-component system, chemotaxis family, protein-glutamate methylesterase/glutaminase